jgi:septum formation protein
MRLVLASASPRRRALLAAADIDVDVDPVHVDERPLAGEAPDAYVERLARLKAEAGAARHPGRVVLGADTTVVIDGDVLGKPRDAAEAVAMLRRLAGRDHDVMTGVAVASAGRIDSFVERTRVTMAPLSPADIDAYVATGEPFGKAGAYAIQGGAARFISGFVGSYTNVVGLPLEKLVEVLKHTGSEEGSICEFRAHDHGPRT